MKKKTLIKLSVGLIIFLVICTFLSRTIEGLLLPQVETAEVERRNLNTIERCEGIIVYEEKHRVRFDLSVNVTKVNVVEGAYVNQGDVLFEVEYAEFAFNLKQKELAVLQAQNAVDDSKYAESSVREVLEKELELAQDDLEMYKSTYPTDGKIYASIYGVVSKLNVQAGEAVPADEVLAEVFSPDSPAHVEFKLPQGAGDLMERADTASVQYDEEIEDRWEISFQNAVITHRTFDEEEQSYTFYGELEKANISDGQRAEITISNDTQEYPAVIPKSAVVSELEDGSVEIYVLRERDGLFGREHYAQSVTVEKLDENTTFLAVQGALYPGETVIARTNKALSNGQTVRIEG